MDYIVFDLEWNQCPYGKAKEDPRMPFEIIEIGAVKLSGSGEYIDSFHALIRPQLYRRLHFQTSRVIGITEKELQTGIPFEEAANAFFSWCGGDYRFCTWGTTDLPELQRNLFYYHMEELLPGPVIYEDVQKLFAIAFETRKVRRSLKNAVEMLELPEEGTFHMAKEDAVYTARIFQRIPKEIVESDFSIDCFQNPRSKRQEIGLRYESYEKFISREFASKEELLTDRRTCLVRCFTCGRPVRQVVKFFADSGGRNYLAVGRCAEHGYVKCKLRVRDGIGGGHYAVRTTKHISEEEMQAIRAKMLALRLKRQRRRRA